MAHWGGGGGGCCAKNKQTNKKLMIIQAVGKFCFHKNFHHQFDMLSNNTAAKCLLWGIKLI